MTEEEWRKLYENFETMDLIYAVDHLDKLRSFLSDGPDFEPPEIRNDLMKLHQLSMEVINQRSESNLAEFVMLAEDIDSEIFQMTQSLEKVRDTISKLIRLIPDSAYGLDDE